MQLYHRIIITYGLILAVTAAAWIWAIEEFSGHPVLLGSAFLAYALGLRHAVDADHIAAIDNVTRKLMQEGRQTVNAGFFFSLGHSSVVLLVSAAVVMTAGAFSGKFNAISSFGSVLGTGISTVFLLVFGLINAVLFAQIYKTFKQVRETGIYSQEDLNHLLSQRGFLSRLFRRLFGLIRRSRQMFFIGFLFGLGFDTSTEVAMIGIAAAGALKGMNLWSIMIFPVLFAAGMSLADTTDGVIMQGVYRWAFLTPVRKLYYNLAITGVSVAVALAVAAIEALGLLGGKLSLKGSFWNLIGALNGDFNTIGLITVGIFISAWALSFLIYHFMRCDEVKPQHNFIRTST
ncbi:MAG: HoxN/HupN/NixA family nickel/cobalt transporter [Candidatus Omnitrophica bacterium]|nr:HoxN/HupN/NixA family nickel/cobalt transporter [Candidatus Omnitrophota bacterium]MDE2222848.1 HoxN/HupN/NixA family nickel/cobalt transporter [Candidatus Omnitrophota bacterium]